MSFINTEFSYRGINSSDFGVMLVRVESGLLKRNFGLQKTINKEKIRGNDVPIHYNTENQTYNIPITICKINGNEPWTDEEWMNVSQWLFADEEYHEFISEDRPDLIYMLQFISGEFNDNFNNEGYIDLQAEMKYPYAVTRTSYSEYDLSDNDTTTIIEIENRSNVLEYYYPMFEFELVGDSTSFKMKNLTVNGEETTFDNLTLNESVCLDNTSHQIESSTGQERISNFNFKFLRLAFGINRLQITGKCRLTFKCSYPIMI